MFTGIVTELGTVVSSTPTPTGRRLTIEAPTTSADMAIGDSLAVNGACLTAVAIDASSVTVDVVQESLDRTNLGELTVGDSVDLERPLAGHGRFDGHIVQGHVDATGTVLSISPEGAARRVRVGVPAGLVPYLVEKGSVTLDGASLTVTAVSPAGTGEAWCEVVLIPHTLAVTVLGARSEGDTVNVETDVLAKYVARYLESVAAGEGR